MLTVSFWQKSDTPQLNLYPARTHSPEPSLAARCSLNYSRRTRSGKRTKLVILGIQSLLYWGEPRLCPRWLQTNQTFTAQAHAVQVNPRPKTDTLERWLSLDRAVMKTLRFYSCFHLSWSQGSAFPAHKSMRSIQSQEQLQGVSLLCKSN